MVDLFWKILNKLDEAPKIMRRLAFAFLFISFASSVFHIRGYVERILTQHDVELISSVAKVCLGTAAFVVACGAAGIFVLATFGAIADHLYEKNEKRCWMRISTDTDLFSRQIGKLVRFAAHVVFLASSLLAALGEDFIAVFCAMVPGEPLRAAIFLINGIVLLMLLADGLHDMFRVHDDTKPPLGSY